METFAELFGRRIRAQRKRLGFSQEQLAEKCDLHPTYIGQLERGEKNASLETIMSVSKGLCIAPSVLFENMSALNVKTTAEEIYDLVLEMSAREQKAVLDIIKSIKSLMN